VLIAFLALMTSNILQRSCCKGKGRLARPSLLS
jgi:hypothetical protein